MAAAIEKLYDVEKGLDEKFDQLGKLQQAASNIKLESVAMVEGSSKLGADTVLEDIKDSLLELLKQEQRVRGESLALERERRQRKANIRRSFILAIRFSCPLAS